VVDEADSGFFCLYLLHDPSHRCLIDLYSCRLLRNELLAPLPGWYMISPLTFKDWFVDRVESRAVLEEIGKENCDNGNSYASEHRVDRERLAHSVSAAANSDGEESTNVGKSSLLCCPNSEEAMMTASPSQLSEGTCSHCGFPIDHARHSGFFVLKSGPVRNCRAICIRASLPLAKTAMFNFGDRLMSCAFCSEASWTLPDPRDPPCS
jgi:hypothetical protein